MDRSHIVKLQNLIDLGQIIENGKTSDLRNYAIDGRSVLGVEEYDENLRQYKELKKFFNHPYILKIVDISKPFGPPEAIKRVVLYREIHGSLNQDVSDLFDKSQNIVDLSSVGKKFVKCCARAIQTINQSNCEYVLSLKRCHTYFYRDINGDWIPKLGVFSFGVNCNARERPWRNWINFGKLLEELANEIGTPHSELLDLINNLKGGAFSDLGFVLRHSSVWELPHIRNLLHQLWRAIDPTLTVITNKKKRNEERPGLTYEEIQINRHIIKSVVWNDWRLSINRYLEARQYDDNMGGFLNFWREKIIHFHEGKLKRQHPFTDENHVHEHLRSLRPTYMVELLNWAIQFILAQDVPLVFNRKIYNSELI